MPETETAAAEKAPPPFTDTGLADHMMSVYGQHLRYCEGLGCWLIWVGDRWETGSTRLLQRMLKATTRQLRQLVLEAETYEHLPALLRAERRGVGEAILALARYEAKQVVPGMIEIDPMLLNLRNGTLDLQEKVLQPHSPDDLIIHSIPWSWHPEAKCPRWEAFIASVCGGDAELIRYVQRCVGYSLTGDVREQVIFLLWGSGANGKSTFLLTLRELLGTYGRAADIGLLTKPSGHEQALFRSRLVVLPEMPEGQRLNESKLKLLTGGDEVVVSDGHSFEPTHKLWLAANQLPEIRGTEHAIWRRLRPIPFNVRIAEKDQDKTLLMKLRQELPGILRWAVDGCVAWQREGLRPPAKVLEATEEYRAEQDRLAAFIDERCEVGRDKSATAKELYEAYRAWAEVNGEFVVSKKGFGQRLAEREFESCKVGANGQRVWRGVSLQRDAADEAQLQTNAAA